MPPIITMLAVIVLVHIAIYIAELGILNQNTQDFLPSLELLLSFQYLTLIMLGILKVESNRSQLALLSIFEIAIIWRILNTMSLLNISFMGIFNRWLNIMNVSLADKEWLAIFGLTIVGPIAILIMIFPYLKCAIDLMRKHIEQ